MGAFKPNRRCRRRVKVMELGLRLQEEVTSYKYPLLLMTLGGPHAQGFGGPTTPFELRGCHVLPLEEVLGLAEDDGAVRHFDGSLPPGIDVLTHDLRRLVGSYLHGSWEALELILAPEPIHITPQAEELRKIAGESVLRPHVASYRTAASSQWLLFEKCRPRRLEQLLAAYRLLLTAIHASGSGSIEIDLPQLARIFEQDHLLPLVERCLRGDETEIAEAEVHDHRRRIESLQKILHAAGERLDSPAMSLCRALDEFVVRTRLYASLAGWSTRLPRGVA